MGAAQDLSATAHRVIVRHDRPRLEVVPNVTADFARRLLLVSNFQICESRLKTIIRPSYEMLGQIARPFVKLVKALGLRPGSASQMFSAPLLSEMK